MVKRIIKNMTTLEVTSALLLAMTLNLNGLRLITGNKSAILSYALFVTFGVVVIASHIQLKRGKPPVNFRVAAALSLAVLWSAVSILAKDGADLQAFVKFCICIAIAYLASQLSGKQRSLALNISLVFSTVFALYAIVNYSYIYQTYLVPKIFNYLEVTLPIGLGLSFSVTVLFVNYNSRRRTAFYATASIIQLYSLMQYSARGNLIFPLAAAMFLLIYTGLGNRKMLFRKMLLMVIIYTAVFYFISQNENNELLTKRLVRLVTATETESRLGIYEYYLGYIRDSGSFLTGIGFSQSKNVLLAAGYKQTYPHNFILELIGELGIAGLILIAAVALEIFLAEKTWFRIIDKEDTRNKCIPVFCFVNAGFLFFAMSYFKSYSIYDGYLLFIFIAMILHGEHNKPDSVLGVKRLWFLRSGK